jgi:aryl-alcohol dehydrogenase-like predicted oxidoreductase
MQYGKFGSTGLFVSRIALGAMTFGGTDRPVWGALGGLDAKAADEIVGTALDAGVNLIDTADVYAGGESEKILGDVLGSRRADVILATKVSARAGTGPNEVGASRYHVTRSLEASLTRLRTDHVDLYQIHGFDPLTPLEETLGALDDAVRQGKVRYIGASNFAARQMMKALGISERDRLPRFVSLQSYYSLVGRDVDHEILPLAREENLGFLSYAPLAAGLLSGKFDRSGTADGTARRAQFDWPRVDREKAYDVLDVLRAVAERREATVAQVALAWNLAQPGVTSVIAGARRPAQLADNLGAVDVALTAQDLAELDAASAPPIAYPAWLQQEASAARLPQQA